MYAEGRVQVDNIHLIETWRTTCLDPYMRGPWNYKCFTYAITKENQQGETKNHVKISVLTNQKGSGIELLVRFTTDKSKRTTENQKEC